VSNVKFCTGFATLSGHNVSLGTEDTSFPITNVSKYKFPRRPCKVTNGAIATLRFQIPASTTIYGFFLSGTNSTKLVVRSYSNSDFTGTNDVNYTDIVPVKDLRTGRFNFISTKKGSSESVDSIDTANRYWEVVSLTTPNSNLDNFYIDSIYLFTSVTTMNYTFQHPYRVSRSRAHIRTDRGNLSHDVIDLNSKKMSITMPWSLPTRAEDQTTGGEEMFYTLMDSSLSDGFVFWENRDLGNNEVDSRAYHVRTITDISVTYPQGTDRIMDAGTLDFEEII